MLRIIESELCREYFTSAQQISTENFYQMCSAPFIFQSLGARDDAAVFVSH